MGFACVLVKDIDILNCPIKKKWIYILISYIQFILNHSCRLLTTKKSPQDPGKKIKQKNQLIVKASSFSENIGFSLYVFVNHIENG